MINVSNCYKIGSRDQGRAADRHEAIEIFIQMCYVLQEKLYSTHFLEDNRYSQSNKSIGMSLAFGTSWYFAWSKYFVCLVRFSLRSFFFFVCFFSLIFLLNGSALMVISTGLEIVTSWEDDGLDG
jgi:hypothetical protein